MVLALVAVVIPLRSPAATLTQVRSQFLVNEGVTLNNQDHATVDMDDQGLFMVSWNSDSYLWMEVKGRAYYADGSPWTNEFQVNKLVEAGGQYSPDVATNGGNRWIVTWADTEARDSTYVYAKIYTNTQNRRKYEFMVNPEQEASLGRVRPDVAMFPNGDAVVIWGHAPRDGSGLNVYVRLFDASGYPLSDIVQINQSPSDPPPVDHTATPDIDVKMVDGQPVAFATWKRWHADPDPWAEILCRKFDPYAMTFEDEFLINPLSTGVHQGRPMVDMNGRGDILMVWQEINPADGEYDVHTRKYSAADSTWGPLLDPPGNDQFTQHRGHGILSESGGMMLAWTRIELMNGLDNVYLQAYDAQGVPLLDTEYLVNETLSGVQRRPALAMTEINGLTHLVVIWESNNDDGSGQAQMGAVFDFDGFPAAGAVKTAGGLDSGRRPRVDFGLEASELHPPARTEQDRPAGPDADAALSGAPNPFNPTTVFSFRLEHPEAVGLYVHDLAGRRVRTLAAGETFTAGNHTVTWHGRDDLGQPVSSGVYLVRLVAGGQEQNLRVTLVR